MGKERQVLIDFNKLFQYDRGMKLYTWTSVRPSIVLDAVGKRTLSVEAFR